MATITAKVVRVTDKEKNYFVSLENKMLLSGWLNKKPENLVAGVTAMFTYTQNGQFNNIDSVMVVPEGAEGAMNVLVEEVLDTVMNAPVAPKAKGLKVKVFQQDSPLKFEAALNQFGEDHKIEFTQTHVTPCGAENPNVVEYKIIYSAVVWYRDL